MGQLVRPSGPRAAVDGVEAGPAEWPWGLCEPGQFAGSAVRVAGPQAATRSDGRKPAPVTCCHVSVYFATTTGPTGDGQADLSFLVLQNKLV